MKIIHILGDDMHIEALFELHKSAMPCIGFDLFELAAALIVKVKNKLGIAFPRFRRGNILNTMSLPKPVGTAKSGNATLRAHAGTCQNNEGFASLGGHTCELYPTRFTKSAKPRV